MSDIQTTASKKPRSEGYIDQINGVIVRDGVTYALKDLPEHVNKYLALVGL